MADEYRRIHDNRVHGHIADHNKKRNFVTGIHNFRLQKDERQNVETQWLESQAIRQDTYSPQTDFPPDRFPRIGAPLRVPKLVVISFSPFWVTATAPYYQWRYPHDIFNIDFATGIINNYVYLEQWDEMDAQTYEWAETWPKDEDIPEWARTMRKTEDSTDKDYMQQLVGKTYNKIYAMGRDVLHAVKQLTDWFHDLDPKGEYHVIAPQWIPYPMPQLNNPYMMVKKYEYTGRYWLYATQPCAVIPQYRWDPAFISPWYNGFGFTGPKCPWLLGGIDPGFGVDVLHIYIGHPVASFGTATGYMDYIAWALSPEAGYIGPTPALYLYSPGKEQVKNYLLPYFWGRRPIWRSYGYDYGLYPESTIGNINTAAEGHKQNWYEYRNIQTMIYTPNVDWNHGWNPDDLMGDAQLDCPSPFFWFGFDTFGEYTGMAITHWDCPDDASFSDTSGGGLKTGYSQGRTVPTCVINEAKRSIFPGLKARVESYYNNIYPQAESVFQSSIENNKLDEFGVSYQGGIGESDVNVDFFKEIIQGYWPSLKNK